MPFALTDPMMLLEGVAAGATSSGSGGTQDSLARLVNGALLVGVAASQWFVPPGGKDGVLTLTSVIGAGVAAFKVDLERSVDSGVTWVKVVVAIDLFTTREVRTALAGGGLYRLNVSTFTTPAATTVYGAFSRLGI